MIHSYPSIYAIGHKEIENLFDGTVVIEEKIDGSQISFMRDFDGRLHLKSKGKDQSENPDQMFRKAMEVVEGLDLVPGAVYRGEYLQKTKHNTLTYNRVPRNHIVLFDVEFAGPGDFLSWPRSKVAEAERLGLEPVPVIFHGHMTPDFFLGAVPELLDRESVLGGAKIEGVVVKNYRVLTEHGRHIAIGKHVSEAFKEKHTIDWKDRNPSQGDVIQQVVRTFRTEARFAKAVQHLAEAGALEGSPRDIGPLLREVQEDLLKEYGEEMKEMVFKRAWKDISKGVTQGLPEWYKQRLLERVLEQAA